MSRCRDVELSSASETVAIRCSVQPGQSRGAQQAQRPQWAPSSGHPHPHPRTRRCQVRAPRYWGSPRPEQQNSLGPGAGAAEAESSSVSPNAWQWRVHRESLSGGPDV
ncbi:hypothetical protein BCR34DRAFT_571665 [Clohesyomyces aquaticus]|uniref:Uncharacterized protein n=1 Tax=Clohesyomyces aquaticus TaxID=1231657 RepID=A0A1Y1Z6J1_9PLEO|nr:hypothetical protein BCR34DRAFT_571665 [Clohesyomyces aquaticus]